jgi:catechol 2,3-dioxygenase-like lactoylglutathione lyase family enzyme
MNMLGRVHHVGIVVDDLDAAGRFAEQTLGWARVRDVTLDANTQAGFFDVGGLIVEMVETSDAEARRMRLGTGQARIEHLALAFDDLEDAIERYAQAGIAFVAAPHSTDRVGTPTEVAGIRTLFTDARTTAGVCLQLVEQRQVS